MTDMTEQNRREDERMREIVDRVSSEAATKAVSEGVPQALKMIGLDVDDPTKLQKDFSFLRSNRIRCDKFYEESFSALTAFARRMVKWLLILGVLAALGVNGGEIKAFLMALI